MNTMNIDDELAKYLMGNKRERAIQTYRREFGGTKANAETYIETLRMSRSIPDTRTELGVYITLAAATGTGLGVYFVHFMNFMRHIR